MARAVIFWVIACGGCSSSHEGLIDAGPDAFVADAWVAPADAGSDACVPQYRFDRVCTLVASRALSAIPYQMQSQYLAVDGDNAYVTFELPSGTMLAVDDVRLGSGGEDAVVFFDRDLHAWSGIGNLLPAAGARGGRLLTLSFGGTIDVTDVVSGSSVLSTSVMGNVTTSSLALLPCTGCDERELLALQWNDALTIDYVTLDNIPFGSALVMLEDGHVRWSRRLAPESFIDALVPTRVVGSLAVAVRNVSDARRCLEAPLPCLDPWHSALVLLDPDDGAILRSIPIEDVVRGVTVGLMGEIHVSANESLVRYSSEGDPVWSQPLGIWAGPHAIDEAHGLAWVAVGLPVATMIGDAEFIPCFVADLLYNYGSFLAALDLATGDVRSVVLLSRTAQVSQLGIRDDGRLVVALNWGGSDVDVCDQTITRDPTATRLDTVLAIVE